MAKNKQINHSRPYVFAAILLAIVTIANITLVTMLSRRNQAVSKKTQGTMSCINRMNSELKEVNGNVLRIVAGIGDPTVIANDTVRNFDNIKDAMNDFEEIEGLSDECVRRYSHAKAFIETYDERLTEFREMWNAVADGGGVQGSAAFESTMNDLYVQDIYPLQITASEMLEATIGIVNKDTGKTMANNAKVFFIIVGLMTTVAVVGELSIFFIARAAKKSRIELEEREKALKEVDAKLKTTRQKASDLAVTNILTGMKNRYALDNDISERLETDRMNLAVFDMDNFRSINDTYGYDFGDEYLAAVAERLTQEFGDVAEIYNITGNEFCFVFNRDITESQAANLVQNVHAVITSPFNVLNLSVQLPASGAVYHYLPGDCLNVNSVLVKLDTAMRNAKINGGNMIAQVTNI